MNLFKYALKNLKIYRNRTIIMMITMVLVVTASVVGLSIKETGKAVSKSYRDEIGASVNIEVDYSKTSQGGFAEAAERITAEQYKKIAALDHVKTYSYLTDIKLNSNQIKAVGEDTQKGDGSMGPAGRSDGGETTQYIPPKLKLIGGSGNVDLPEFQKGLRKISEGKAPKKDYEILISQELAELNNLKVGDSVLLLDIPGKEESEFKVSGIYEDKTKMDGGSGMDMPIFNRRNEIITTFSSAMSMDKDEVSQVSATFELDDPKYFDAFEKGVRNLGIDDTYTIAIDEASYNKAVGPIDNLNKTMGYFIFIILVIAAGVLTLLSVLSVRERQYEIGVLRAMGMKKSKVGANFVLESFIALLVALVIGFGIGATLAKPIANSLLQQEITAIEEKEPSGMQTSAGMFTLDDSPDVSPIDKINVTIDYMVLLEIAAIGVLIVLLSNLFNLLYIMKFQPMEIMRSKK